MKLRFIHIFMLSICSVQLSCAQPINSAAQPIENIAVAKNNITTGAERLATYLPLLKGKKVGDVFLFMGKEVRIVGLE